jgi:MoaA/NifB/PqqE/SkfB family radical SAM enzyme
MVIEAFLKPQHPRMSIANLSAHRQDVSKFEAFIDQLINQGILVTLAHSESMPSVTAFFTDVFDFEEDRLHSPLGIELELTLKCMRRCSYCAYRSAPDVSTKSDLRRETYQQLFRKFAQIGVFYLRFTGGDPLTRVDCLDILRDADEYHFGLAIASDLSVFEEAHAEQLGQLKNLTALQTTLDGPTPAIADELRGSGNFRRVSQGLKLLAKHDVPTIVGTILTKRNISSIYQTAQYLSQWDISWCVSPLYSAGRGQSCADLIPDDSDLANAAEQFSRAVGDRLVKPADPGWHAFAHSANLSVKTQLWAGQPWFVRSPDRILRVDPAGRCYTSVHLKELIGDEVYVGLINSENLISLWNNAPLLNELRSGRQRNSYFGDVLDIREIRRATWPKMQKTTV